jgi:hypothetical protein
MFSGDVYGHDMVQRYVHVRWPRICRSHIRFLISSFTIYHRVSPVEQEMPTLPEHNIKLHPYHFS